MSISHQAMKGNSYARRARKTWLLQPEAGFGGNGEKVACVHCGAMVDYDTMHVDRKVPGSMGGTYRRSNIQPSCTYCNCSRKDNLEWTSPRLAVVPA
jgi:HNH endonuclease